MKKLLVIALALLIFLSFSSCNDADNDTQTIDSTEIKCDDLILAADKKTNYKIIWKPGKEDAVITAFRNLTRAFSDLGISIESVRDFAAEPSEFEILIGNTNRTESEKYSSLLRDRDYLITVEGNKVVILGGTEDYTLKAVNDFIANYIKPEDGIVRIMSDLYVLQEGKYDVAGIELNGIDIADYSISYFKEQAQSKVIASSLQGSIAERMGKTLDMHPGTDESSHEIIIDVSQLDRREYAVYYDGQDVRLCGGTYGISLSLDAFLGMMPERSNSVVGINIDTEMKILTAENTVYPEEPTLSSDKLVALCDQKNAKLVLIDLNAPDPTSKDAVIWEWKPTSSLGFNMYSDTYKNRIDEAILRYSEVLQSYVFCVTSSQGYMAIVKYPSGEKVWEGNASGLGPHSCDYLPNGNLAVVCSGNSDTSKGCIRIYSTSQGKNTATYVSDSVVSAHGVLWDDENRLLWVLGSSELISYRIGGTDAKPTLEKVKSYKTPFGGCHNLSLWASDSDHMVISGSSVTLFSKAKGTFTNDFVGVNTVAQSSVKCIDCYSDGTIIFNVATNVYASHDTDTLYVVDTSTGKAVTEKYSFSDRAFYKARRVCAYYN